MYWRRISHYSTRFIGRKVSVSLPGACSLPSLNCHLCTSLAQVLVCRHRNESKKRGGGQLSSHHGGKANVSIIGTVRKGQ